MLKIKDNVDLKELEKFGFYKGNKTTYCYEIEPVDERVDCDEEDFSKYGSNFSQSGFAMIEANEITRVIEFFTTTDDEVWWNMDIIFDLIQAGLVEKVENDN